ncbi:MAG: LCP family protein, partial [Acidimicrobiales bacterium]
MTIVVVAVLSAVVLAYARETVGDIPRIGFGATLAADEPDSDATGADSGQGEREQNEEDLEPALNFLLVGVDSVATLPPNHPLRLTRGGTQLTDTMIVLRVDPETGQASAMSIPRDLWVPIAGAGQEGKINSALALGGPDALVRTIQDFLDIPINRYVQVDFNGFLELIHVMGGVDVFIEYPLRDVKAQLDIGRTGCVSLSPDEALSYVRSRTLTALVDGRWIRVDQNSDLGRIARQQDFLVLTLNRAFSRGLTDPATLKGLLDNVLGGGFVTLDDRLTPDELLQLASDFSSFEGDDLDRYTLPVVLGSVGKASIVRLVESEAQEVLDVFRSKSTQDRAFRLAVRNGAGDAGLADEVQVALEARGFNVVEATNADGFGYDNTTIVFDPSQRADAVELERWLLGGAVLLEQAGSGPVELILGADYLGVLEVPRAPIEEAQAPVDDQFAVGDPEQVVTTETATPLPTPTPTPRAIATIRGC